MIKGEQFTVDVCYLVVSCFNRTVLATSRSIYYGLEDCYWQSISVLNPHSVLERVSLQIFTSVLFAKKNTWVQFLLQFFAPVTILFLAF